MSKHEASWEPNNNIPMKMWSTEDSMAGLFDQLPNNTEQAMQTSLTNLEAEISAIRKKLDTKPRKVTIATLDDKLNLIVKILNQNGLILKVDCKFCVLYFFP